MGNWLITRIYNASLNASFKSDGRHNTEHHDMVPPKLDWSHRWLAAERASRFLIGTLTNVTGNGPRVPGRWSCSRTARSEDGMLRP